MTVESDSDRLAMLADFGQSVTFSPGSTYPDRNSETVDIIAIFDQDYFEVRGIESVSDNSQPALLARTIDTAKAIRNSMIEIDVDVYKVVGVEPDGTGITVLRLEGPK